MDLQQLFGISMTSAGISYTASHCTIPSTSKRLLSSLKFDIGNSPNSPFTTYFDSDTLTTLSDSQEQLSSTGNLSGLSPSCNSAFETTSYFSMLSPPMDCLRDSLYLYSGRTSNFKNALQKLETALMEPAKDEKMNAGQRSMSWRQEHQGSSVLQCQTSLVLRTCQSGDAARVEKHHKSMEEASQSLLPDNLKQLLIACAKALNDNNYDLFEKLIEKARCTIPFVGKPESKDLLSYMQILYEICPYLKFGYMAANGAIAEACKNEDRIHIIDFQIAQGTQWITLLQALAARPSGCPHVRITDIDDPVNQYARGDGLAAVGRRLATISQNFNIPVEFIDTDNPVNQYARGDGLAAVFAPNIPLQLHHTPDESVDVKNPRDELLRMVKSLTPKVVTLVEQESNINTTSFFHRFVETLDYYLAMSTRYIVNVIAKERVERHEVFGKWKSRLTMAGFKQYPLSSYVNSVIRNMLKCYLEHYNLVEKDGAMLLGWKERSLISAFSWQSK
ncbi:hypothetical protein UlMin_003452 [Ulmus minor]